MRNSRKILYKITGVLTLLTAFVLASSFVSLIFNIDGYRQLFEGSILNLIGTSDVSLSTVINFSTVYLLVAAVANTYFGIFYFKISKLNFPMFIHNKKRITRIILLNLLISTLFVPIIFAVIATLLPVSKAENNEYNILYVEEQKKNHFRQVVSKDPRLFAMTVKINVLKHQLKNKEINEQDYQKLLNDIITTGTSI